MYSAKNCDLPRIFERENEHGMPVGAAVMNGIVASALLIIAPILPSQDLFWSFFALNIVTLLMSYLPMFPAFLKLRSIDPHARRPFTVPGGKSVVLLVAWAPVVVMVLGMVATVVPLGASPAELSKLPMLALTLAVLALGEANCRWGTRRRASQGRARVPSQGMGDS